MPVDGGLTAAGRVESSRKSQALLNPGPACDFRLISTRAAQGAAHRHRLRDLCPSASSAIDRLCVLRHLRVAAVEKLVVGRIHRVSDPAQTAEHLDSVCARIASNTQALRDAPRDATARAVERALIADLARAAAMLRDDATSIGETLARILEAGAPRSEQDRQEP
jgi:hypothetical protein